MDERMDDIHREIEFFITASVSSSDGVPTYVPSDYRRLQTYLAITVAYRRT